MSAAEFFTRAGKKTEALKYYDLVIAEAGGDLKARAKVASELLR
jgi:hypothetical protein